MKNPHRMGTASPVLQFLLILQKTYDVSHDRIARMTHAEQIASQLNIKPSQVTAVINLLDDGTQRDDWFTGR